jgi:hypothetical protein
VTQPLTPKGEPTDAQFLELSRFKLLPFISHQIIELS